MPNADTSIHVAIVEDDATFRQSVKQSLELDGLRASAFGDAESATSQFAKDPPTVVITDMRLPNADGFSVLEHVRKDLPDVPVIMMTGHGDIPTAIQSIRGGAYDFLEKPFSRERLVSIVRRAAEQFQLLVENRDLRRALESRSGIDLVVRGDSGPMRELRSLIMRLAPTPVDVLVLGETGTGKELVARCLHEYSRREGNFVAVNCAAVPESLFESELFGHEAGAFTGAGKQRIGRIEHARNGTLFLDEVEAMPLALQAKVLRVLQEREIERLGSNKTIPVEFRVIAATKVDLAQLCKKGEFRLDLFYRLNVASLRIPPLRGRIDDILGLFALFLQQAALRYHMPVPEITAEQHQTLLAAPWEGNVRELKACAERAILGMPLFADGREGGDGRRTYDELLASIERSLLEEALKRNGGSVKLTCAELSIPPATMYRKLKALAVEPAFYKNAQEEGG